MSKLTIKTDTASECCVTSIEQYDRYFLFQVDPSGHNNYLISQRFEVGEGCFEGYEPARVSVDAKSVDIRTGEVSKEPVWSFSTKGSSGERGYNDMRGICKVFFPGCCAATDTFKYFSLFTGSFIGAAHFEPLILEIPNTSNMRYIFMQDNTSSEFMGKDEQLVLFYSDRDHLKQQIGITITDAPIPFYCPTQINFAGQDTKKYSLWQRLAFDGVSIIIEIDCKEMGEARIEIPLMGDTLSIGKAIISGASKVKIEETHNDRL